MRECMICGAHHPVLSCEKIQLCNRCAEVLWTVLLPKIHPERVQQYPMTRGWGEWTIPAALRKNPELRHSRNRAAQRASGRSRSLRSCR